ncbi:MAG: DUF6580 family putative transport protein [Acidobacteriaceae bacterium]
MSYLIILIGSLLRVIPHPANFVPIGAIALFGGARLSKKQAVILPVAAMVISDFFIGFDSLASRLSVYGSFVIIGLIGMLLKNRKGIGYILGGSVLGSIVFYLVTNFVFFHSAGLYPQTLNGLVASYVNAIPFFRNSLMADALYSLIFFGAYELAGQRTKILNYVKNYKSQGTHQGL